MHGNEAGPDSEAQFVTCLSRADLRGMSVGQNRGKSKVGVASYVSFFMYKEEVNCVLSLCVCLSLCASY